MTAQYTKNIAWICSVTYGADKDAVTVDISGVIAGNIGKIGSAALIDRIAHSVLSVERQSDERVIVTIRTNLWREGRRFTVSEPLIVERGVPQYR
ncbi:MAG: hypothetical protein ACSHX3_05645 [Litorimonas sp.]